MKIATVQVACPASPGTVDFTDSQFSGDVLGGLFLGGTPTANDSTTAQGRFSFGATDLTNQICLSFGFQDATAGAVAQWMVSTTKTINEYSGSSLIAPQGTYSSTLSNGIRMNIGTTSTGRLMSGMLIGGSDNAFKVGSVQFISTDTSKVVTHGLGGTPDAIILLIAGGSSATEVGCACGAIGFWERLGGTATGLSSDFSNAANPTAVTSIISSADSGRCLNAGSSVATATLTSVGSTTFTVSLSGAPGYAVLVGWIALRGTSAAMVAKAFTATTPTANGSQTLLSGMSAAPQGVILLPSRMLNLATVTTDDTAGGFGMSLNCNNQGATKQYGGQFSSSQVNVATSVAKNMCSAQYGVGLLTDAGAYAVAANFSSYDSGGVTANFTTTNGAANQMAGFAFAIPGAAAPSPPFYHRRNALYFI